MIRKTLSVIASCAHIVVLPARPAHAQCPDSAAVASYVAAFAAARKTNGFGSTMSVEDAECARAKLVRELSRVIGPVIGYKAGFTNVPAQRRMGLRGPAWGVMFANQLAESGTTFPVGFGALPQYEPDLVVVVKDSALALAESPIAALQHLEAVVPFIELPDLMIDNVMTGTISIATNISFRGGVLGRKVTIQPTEAFLNALGSMTVVTEDGTGKELGRAKGELLMGNPINVAMWLAKELRKAGFVLKRGDLLSLGAFRPPTPAVSGTTIVVHYLGLPENPAVMVRFVR